MKNTSLYWIDLETTGLDPETDKILEVAVARASFEDPFNHHFVYQACLPFAISDWMTLPDVVYDMHKRSGLLHACAADDLPSLYTVGQDLERIIEPGSYLAGSSVWFDQAFLTRYLPRVSERFSHKMYDVSAIKLFCQSMGMPVMPKGEAHRAVQDIDESVAHARACRAWLAGARAQQPVVMMVPTDTWTPTPSDNYRQLANQNFINRKL